MYCQQNPLLLHWTLFLVSGININTGVFIKEITNFKGDYLKGTTV